MRQLSLCVGLAQARVGVPAACVVLPMHTHTFSMPCIPSWFSGFHSFWIAVLTSVLSEPRVLVYVVSAVVIVDKAVPFFSGQKSVRCQYEGAQISSLAVDPSNVVDLHSSGMRGADTISSECTVLGCMYQSNPK